ncbi:MAG: carbon-nitrogen family hydrolase [Ignavibacteria bacterium]
MRVGLCQYSPMWEDKDQNKKKILEILSKQKSEFDILVFPEMTLTGFSMNKLLAEIFEVNESPTLDFFSKLAKELSTNIAAGFIEKEEDKVFNTLFFINRSGEIISRYRKIHLFSFARENRYYNAGTEPVIVENEDLKIGLSICYDLRFPELFRFYGKSKVDLILNIANWPQTRIDHFVHLLKSRAIENQCFMIGVNRVGYGGREYYDGRSSIFDPLGNEITLIKDEEKLIEAEIDLTQIQKVREQFPFLNDIKLI